MLSCTKKKLIISICSNINCEPLVLVCHYWINQTRNTVIKYSYWNVSSTNKHQLSLKHYQKLYNCTTYHKKNTFSLLIFYFGTLACKYMWEIATQKLEIWGSWRLGSRPEPWVHTLNVTLVFVAKAFKQNLILFKDLILMARLLYWEVG